MRKTPYHPPHNELRKGCIEWMSEPRYTHAITLAPNQAFVSLEWLNRAVSRFSLEADRYALNVAHPEHQPMSRRLDMILMVEKPDVNAHCHGVANFSDVYLGNRTNEDWKAELARIWSECTKLSGSCVIEPRNGRGFAAYATKELRRSDMLMILSQDFHPERKFVRTKFLAPVAASRSLSLDS